MSNLDKNLDHEERAHHRSFRTAAGGNDSMMTPDETAASLGAIMKRHDAAADASPIPPYGNVTDKHGKIVAKWSSPISLGMRYLRSMLDALCDVKMRPCSDSTLGASASLIFVREYTDTSGQACKISWAGGLAAATGAEWVLDIG